MKDFKPNRISQIVYPLLVYYLFYNLFIYFFSYFFADNLGRLFCLMLSAVITLIPLAVIYKKSPIYKSAVPIAAKDFTKDLLFLIAAVSIGILLNIVITKSGLLDSSDAMQTAAKTLSSGNKAVKIVTNAVVIPILEEVLYRGIILGQLLLWKRGFLGVIVSAFLFGLFHFNVVQFLYAFLMGIVLGYVYKNTGKLWLCILSHGLINLIVIIFAS